MTLANRLTMLRVVLAAAVFASLLSGRPAGRAAAFVLFLLAMLTDWLDGHLARSTGTTSPFGKVADPLADKILIIGTLLALLGDGRLRVPLWTIFAVVARDLAVGGLRVIAGAQGKILAAESWGKVKMVVQSIAVLLMILAAALDDFGLGHPLALAAARPLAALCAAVSLTSLWSYWSRHRALLEKSWG